MAKKMGPEIPALHKTTHQDGGTDEIEVTGLSGKLSGEQRHSIYKNGSLVGTNSKLDLIEGTNVTLSTNNDGEYTHVSINSPSTAPLAHASTHEKGGADYVDPMRFATYTVSTNAADMADYSDMRTAIVALLAAGGGTIVALGGSYTISTEITITDTDASKMLRIVGVKPTTINAGANITIFNCTMSTPLNEMSFENIIFNVNGYNARFFSWRRLFPQWVLFDKCYFSQGTSTQPFMQFQAEGVGQTRNKVHFDKCKINGPSLHSFFYGTYVSAGGGFEGITFEDCFISTQYPLLRTATSTILSNVEINNCLFDHQGKEFIYCLDDCRNLRITNCYGQILIASPLSYLTALYGNSFSDVLIANNNLTVSGGHIIADQTASSFNVRILGNSFTELYNGRGVELDGRGHMFSNNVLTADGGAIPVINFQDGYGIIMGNTWPNGAPTITNVNGITVNNLTL